MICTLMYRDENNDFYIRGFENYSDAADELKHLQENEEITEQRIMVDYNLVEFYKEKYELLFDRLLNEKSSSSKL